MAGEHDIDEFAARMLEYRVGVVGLVGHEDDGRVGQRRYGEVKPGIGGAGIVDSTKPEAGAVALDGYVLVDEDRDAVAGKRADDERSTDGGVVVAEAGITQGAGQGAEDLGAAVGCALSDHKAEGAVGDEVPGEQNHVRCQRVDVVDDAL